MRWAVAACALAGCGRFAFDGRSDAAAGSGTSDGATLDAAPGDASDAAILPDAFSQTAACTGFALCDSFEDSSFHAVWTTDPGATLDTTHAHRGLQSVHLHEAALNTGQMGYVQLSETQTLAGASPPTTFYVRGWYYLAALPAGSNRMEAISIEGGGSTGDYTFIHADDTVIYTQSDGRNADTTVPPPTNTWFCLVFRVTRGAAGTGSLGLVSDVLAGLDLPNATTDSSASPLKVVRVGIGFAGTNVFNAQPALDVWVDDVIVDTQPLTCAQ